MEFFDGSRAFPLSGRHHQINTAFVDFGLLFRQFFGVVSSKDEGARCPGVVRFEDLYLHPE
jgi:hypothetical protein